MIKISCNTCGKELFTKLSAIKKATTTISEVEEVTCSDCILNEIKNREH